ncbi:MAG TPA: hypothetical protein VK459_24590 [Polyangiaceae bacterium]|jgi:hypothetical protein|nr:hypothetical protein [Polyangiaceae bacterium]
MKTTLILGAMALLLVACEEQKSDAPASSAPARGATSAAAAAPATGTEAADDLATEQDFEEEAVKEITADNLESEVDKLEKEIGQ